jgi:signal transduction histidine kinase/HPt (histidine-containing phosphotransfer) domain-containing protein
LKEPAVFADKRILIIDDADTIRSYLKNVLMHKGAAVEGAATGGEGLEKSRQDAFDLILLDLILPDIDGIEVLKQMRATNETSTIVMITGHGGIRSAIAAVQLGADGYIQKHDITMTTRDHVEFLYALEQAMEHRAGIIAKQQLEQIRIKFYSMVTHDLRSPTSHILMATSMLTDGPSPLSPAQLELVQFIDQSANKVLQLINDYLDFSQIDADYLRLNLEEVILNDVVESSVQRNRLPAQAKQQMLTADLPAMPISAEIDAERLGQVLDNLLSNAIKYTPAGGTISLRLHKEDGQAVFHIADTGIGIPSDHLEELFTLYHRVHTEQTNGIQGTGLGLVIVREIIDAHDGSIRVESEGVPGKGTTFIFSIPLKARKPAEIDPGSAYEDAGMLPFDEGELLQDFMQETSEQIGILRGSFDRLKVASQDDQLWDTAKRVAHTLKGNAGALQFEAVFQLAVQIEEILNGTDRDALADQLDHLCELVEQIELAVSDKTQPR